MTASFSSRVLPLVVFITGGCLLITEVVATRVLSPYFGNTIYTFSSVISVVLGALSIGYSLGGRLADRHPSHSLFYSLITFGGLTLLLMTSASVTLLPLWGYDLPLSSGPLIVSLLLFTIPSLLLGTLSPFAITLISHESPDKGVGGISGRIFFWSTLGSIAGTLLAGFWLVPSFGVQETLFGVSLTVLVVGLVGLLFHRPKQMPLGAFLLFAGLSSVVGALFLSQKAESNVLYDKDGLYERIQVIETLFQGKPVRALLLDRSLSSAIPLEGDSLVFPYAQYYQLIELTQPAPKRALVLGAGAYTIPMELRRRYPDIQVDVVDIEPKLEEVSREFFGLQDDPSIRSFTTDGRRFLHDSDTEYDLIFSDVYASLFSLPAHLSTQEFFELAQQHLSENGLFIANIIGSLSRQSPSFFLSEWRTFQAVWPQSFAFYTDSRASLQPQNILLVGAREQAVFRPCETETRQSTTVLFAELCDRSLQTEQFFLDEYVLLQDRKAPVDHLSRLLIQQQQWDSTEFHPAEAAAVAALLQEDSPRDIAAFISKEIQAFFPSASQNLPVMETTPLLAGTLAEGLRSRSVQGAPLPDVDALLSSDFLDQPLAKPNCSVENCPPEFYIHLWQELSSTLW